MSLLQRKVRAVWQIYPDKRKHQVDISKEVEKLRDGFQSLQYHFAKTSSRTTIAKFEGAKKRT